MTSPNATREHPATSAIERPPNNEAHTTRPAAPQGAASTAVVSPGENGDGQLWTVYPPPLTLVHGQDTGVSVKCTCRRYRRQYQVYMSKIQA